MTRHHHLVCEACDGIEDVDCPVADSLTPADTHGYTLTRGAEVIYWGLCLDCTR